MTEYLASEKETVVEILGLNDFPLEGGRYRKKKVRLIDNHSCYSLCLSVLENKSYAHITKPCELVTWLKSELLERYIVYQHMFRAFHKDNGNTTCKSFLPEIFE